MTTTITTSELIDYIASIEVLISNVKINMSQAEDINSTLIRHQRALSNVIDAKVSLSNGNVSDCKAYLNICADIIYGLGDELHYGFNNTYRSVGRMCFVAAQAL